MANLNSRWRGLRVLVTGCTGLLGSAVVRELFAAGADVVGLVHERPANHLSGRGEHIHFIHGSADNVFRLHSAMAVHEIAAVFHLTGTDPSAVLKAVNLYAQPIPVVTAKPRHQFTVAHQSGHSESRLSVARFGELFGPGDRKLTRVVPKTALELLAGERNALPLDGPARDYLFVRDAAHACLRVAEDFAKSGPREHSFHSAWHMSERQMAAAVRDVFAKRAVAIPESAPTANPLGWEPVTTFAADMTETLAWYREFNRTGVVAPMRKAA